MMMMLIYLFVDCSKFDKFLLELVDSVVLGFFVRLQFVHLALDGVHRLKRRHFLHLSTTSRSFKTRQTMALVLRTVVDDATTRRRMRQWMPLPLQMLPRTVQRL